MSTFQTALNLTDSSAPSLILPPSATGENRTYEITQTQLHNLVEKFRQSLANIGIVKDQDVISMSLTNCAEFVVAFLAIGNHRCVAAPLNPAYTSSEVEFYLDDSKAKLLLVPKGAVKQNTPAVQTATRLGIRIAEVELVKSGGYHVSLDLQGQIPLVTKFVLGSGKPKESDIALLLHTSGTTGRPKAVPLTHLNLTTSMRNIVKTYQLSSQDRSFLVMPLFHVHGLLAGLLAPLLSRGSIVIPAKFAASTFWSELIMTKSNWYTAVPTIHQNLLNTPKPNVLPKLRFIRSCSSALSPATFKALEQAFNAPVLEAYAMTEAAHQMTSNPLPPGDRRPGTVGIGQGVEIATLDDDGNHVEEGEVCIRGKNVTLGYLNNAEANSKSFTKDGFFRTGDRGRLSKDGYLSLTGRIKELINRAGEKLSPLEIDGALLEVDDVGEAVSFAVPDSKYGEIVWAVVVAKGKAKISQETIQASVSKKLSKFKVPEKIIITEQIPKTATGKIQRRNISTWAQEQVNKENRTSKL